jgi:hypothetical protein
MALHDVASVTITISRKWDDVTLQTRGLRPRSAVAALVVYTLDPWPIDGGMPPRVAEAFAQALTRCGMIAGRWFDHTPPQGNAQFLPAKHRRIRRVIWRLTGRWVGDVVLTQSPKMVMELLDQGWSMQF